MSLFPEQAPPAEPHWLAEARRRSQAVGELTSITAKDRSALLAAYDELRARLSTVEAEKAGLKQELADQEREKLALVQENQALEHKWLLAHEALLVAMNGLEWCYDVCDYPADGTSLQAKALDNAKHTLIQIAAAPAPTAPLAAAAEAATLDLATATHIHATTPHPAFDPAREVFYPGSSSAAEYDASVADVCRRIASGEIQPREPDEDEPAKCQNEYGPCKEHCGQCKNEPQ